MRELVREAELADAGLAHDGDDRAVAPCGPVADPAQVLDLGVAAAEAREAAKRRGLQARPGLTRSRQLEDLDRVREALHWDGPERPDLDVALGQPHGLARQAHRPRRRQLLHAGRQVRGLAHGRVVHPEIAADRAHHDLARVEADADLGLHALRSTQLLRIAPHTILHPEGGITRAHGVILVGEWRPEQRHDPVPHHLVNGALIAVHRVHHLLDDRVEQLARLLGITVGQQLHRALEVGEQDGHLLAFTLKRRPGR